MSAMIHELRAGMDVYDPGRATGLVVDEWGTWHPQARGDTGLEQQNTMRDALVAALSRPPDRDACEWRIHFHVPLFAEDFGGLGSTREAIRRTIQAKPATSHFEIETYTWSVLPEGLRVGLAESISREYAWALGELCAKPSS